MNEQKQIVQDIIEAEPMLVYLILSGSRLYGTNHTDSDYDYRGVFANRPDEVFGLEKRGSQVYKSEDITLHGVHKLIELAIKANPNILELFFADEHSIYLNPIFKKHFIDNRHLFLTQKCYHTYSGYAFSQVQRSKSKSSHGILREKYKVGPEADPYDSKFAMHTVRLMMNAKEILKYGTLHPHMQGDDLEFLTEVRTGKAFSNASMFYRYVEQMDKELSFFNEVAKENDIIPHHINKQQIFQLLVDFYMEYYGLEKINP